jgi:hypothetical protein
MEFVGQARHLVAVIRGANAPAISKTITEQLEHENKVLRGEAQRRPIGDPVVDALRHAKKKEIADHQVSHLSK